MSDFWRDLRYGRRMRATSPGFTIVAIPALKQSGNVQITRLRRFSLRNLLVLAEVALSLSLLLITGFLVLGHQQISDVAAGFNPNDLYLVTLDSIRDGSPRSKRKPSSGNSSIARNSCPPSAPSAWPIPHL
jgi:hypothetical protein